MGVRGGDSYGTGPPYIEWGRYPTCDGTSYTAISVTNPITDGLWHFLTFTYDGETVKSYLDGSFKQQVTQSGMCPNQTNFTIGDTYNGNIDEARVYNRALSSQEISSLYNSGNGCVP